MHSCLIRVALPLQGGSRGSAVWSLFSLFYGRRSAAVRVLRKGQLCSVYAAVRRLSGYVLYLLQHAKVSHKSSGSYQSLSVNEMVLVFLLHLTVFLSLLPTPCSYDQHQERSFCLDCNTSEANRAATNTQEHDARQACGGVSWRLGHYHLH